MQLDLLLTRRDEAERLRTAAYRFAELKAADPPRVEVLASAGRLTGQVDFRSGEAAAEFASYWRAFSAEQPGWHGFRDV